MHVFKLITNSDRTENKTEVTRWVVKGGITESTYDDLINRLRRLFGRNSKQFFISWYDGSDYCTVRDIHDLQEAIDFFTESDSTDKAVRLYVSPDRREHHTIFGVIPDEEHHLAPSVQNETVEENDPGQPAVKATVQEEDDQQLAELTASTSITAELDEEESTPEPVVPTFPITENQASMPMTVIPQYPTVPVNPYATFGMAYPYPQYYPTMDPSVFPVMSQPIPQTTAAGVARTSTTGVIPSAPRASIVRQSINEGPDMEMLKKIENLKRQPSTTVRRQSKPINPVPVVPKPSQPLDDKQCKAKYISAALETLRAMGYKQSEKELKKLIKAHKGNLNEILDSLEARHK